MHLPAHLPLLCATDLVRPFQFNPRSLLFRHGYPRHISLRLPKPVAVEPHDVLYYTESDQVARWGTNRHFLCAALQFIAERRSSAYLTPVWVESKAKEDPVEMRGSKSRHCGETKYSADLNNSSVVVELHS